MSVDPPKELVRIQAWRLLGYATPEELVAWAERRAEGDTESPLSILAASARTGPGDPETLDAALERAIAQMGWTVPDADGWFTLRTRAVASELLDRSISPESGAIEMREIARRLDGADGPFAELMRPWSDPPAEEAEISELARRTSLALAVEPDTQPEAMAPVEDRLESLDILRGFALIGIFVVNIYWWADYPFGVSSHWSAPVDQWTLFVTDLFFSGKFLSLFSFLFGLGFAVQFERASPTGGFELFFVRRLAALFMIGCAHAALLSPADILIHYSLLGLVLLWFRRLSAVALAALGVVLLSLTTFITLKLAPWGNVYQDNPISQIYHEGLYALFPPGPEEFEEVFTSRNIGMMIRYRLDVYTILTFVAFFSFFYYSLGMFFLGAAAWRLRVFQEPRRWAGLIFTVMALGLVIGLPSNLLFSLCRSDFARSLTTWDDWLFDPYGGLITYETKYYWDSIFNSWGGPAQCLFYAGGILTLTRFRLGRLILLPLRDFGRMALTNYILQSLAGVLIFSGLGLAHYGQVAPHDCVKIVAAIVVLQMAFSAAWMRRFRFGPMEWLWRTMNYGTLQPILKKRDRGREAA